MLFTVFKFPISIIQTPKDYYTFLYTIKNRFTGMFLVLAEGSNIYNTAFVTPTNMWKLLAKQLYCEKNLANIDGLVKHLF